MRIAQIRSMDISNGLGVGAALFTQGCPFHCKGCFNSSTWDYEGGILYDQEQKEKILETIRPEYITRFSLLGGEPLSQCNIPELLDLILTIREEKPNIEIWCYTGDVLENLWKRCETEPELQEILNQLSVLVDGPFIQEQKDLTLAFRGSSNQRLIDMRQSSPSHIETLDI
jgi:anaerobic ribonucleoside-triphosphate reductase activating protein